MSVNLNRIFNIVHTSGYELVNVNIKDLSPHDQFKFGLFQPEELGYENRTEFFPSYANFIRPKNFHDIVLKEFDIEKMYIEIVEFVDKHKSNISYKTYDGLDVYGEDLIELVNKYGWLNWANEDIDVGIYDYLETFNKKFGLKLDPFEKDKNIRNEVLIYGVVHSFLEDLVISQEDTAIWHSLFLLLNDGYSHPDNLAKNVGLHEDNDGKRKIQPISPGANLYYFHNLKMQKYSIGSCIVCDKKYINKKGRLYCSNSCKTKNYLNKKPL